MKKDLIVTTISENYNWVDIKNWIKSLTNTSYKGDILILAYNFKNENHEFLEKLKKFNVQIILPKNTYRAEEENEFIWHSGLVNPNNAHKLIHNVRLFHLWQYFNEFNNEDYKRVIFTDGRDVIFQKNPSEWLDKYMIKEILVPSEGILYKNEFWNRNNALSNYGPYIYDSILKESDACNVGTFACSFNICKDLCLILYLMSNNIGHADQPSFNILTKTLLKDKCQYVDYKDSWALQIGAIVNNLDKYSKYNNNLFYPINSNEPYCLIHQYDRIDNYKKYYDLNI